MKKALVQMVYVPIYSKEVYYERISSKLGRFVLSFPYGSIEPNIHIILNYKLIFVKRGKFMNTLIDICVAVPIDPKYF